MNQIEILGIRKYPSYKEVSYKMRFTLPAAYGTGQNPINNLTAIVGSWPSPNYFAVEVLPVDGTVITYIKTDSVNSAATVGQIQTSLTTFYSSIRTNLDSLVVSPDETLAGLVWNGSAWVAFNPPVQPSVSSEILFKGRANTFRTPGRAGTAGQKILSLHNSNTSPVIVTINKVCVDLVTTVVKAITVAPPIVRIWKVTVLPTNGTALIKNKIGGISSSNSAVTVLGDASADGTGSASTLTATLPAGAILAQEFSPRLITGAGYESADRVEFLRDTKIVLGSLEGIVIFLDYTAAGQNPTTDMWIAGIEWQEN